MKQPGIVQVTPGYESCLEVILRKRNERGTVRERD